MIEYIDKEYTKSLFENSDKHILEKDALCRVNSVPVEDVVSRKLYEKALKDVVRLSVEKTKKNKCGEWMSVDDCMTICSECGYLGCNTKFCPNCGIRMHT